MQKLTILALAAMFILPLTANAWDSQDALDEYERDSRENTRMLNQWRRDNIIEDQRRAIKNRNWEDVEYQQRRLEQQRLRERIMGE